MGDFRLLPPCASIVQCKLIYCHPPFSCCMVIIFISWMCKVSLEVLENSELYLFFLNKVFFHFLVEVLGSHYVKKKGNCIKAEQKTQNCPIRPSSLILCVSKSLCSKYLFNLFVFTMYVKFVLSKCHSK